MTLVPAPQLQPLWVLTPVLVAFLVHTTRPSNTIHHNHYNNDSPLHWRALVGFFLVFKLIHYEPSDSTMTVRHWWQWPSTPHHVATSSPPANEKGILFLLISFFILLTIFWILIWADNNNVNVNGVGQGKGQDDELTMTSHSILGINFYLLIIGPCQTFHLFYIFSTFSAFFVVHISAFLYKSDLPFAILAVLTFFFLPFPAFFAILLMLSKRSC